MSFFPTGLLLVFLLAVLLVHFFKGDPPWLLRIVPVTSRHHHHQHHSNGRMKTVEPPLPLPPQPSAASAIAVKIDLTAADKTIRPRPGSAPELAAGAPTAVAAPLGGCRTIKGSLKQQRSLDRNEVKRKSRQVTAERFLTCIFSICSKGSVNAVPGRAGEVHSGLPASRLKKRVLQGGRYARRYARLH